MEHGKDWKEIAERIMQSEQHKKQIRELMEDGSLDSQIPSYQANVPEPEKK